MKSGVLTLRLLMSYIYMEHQFLMFLDHTQRRTTVGRTPLDEWSARRRDLYLTTHDSPQTNIHAPGGIRTHDLSRWAACGRCVWSRNIKNGCSIYIYDISSLRVKGSHLGPSILVPVTYLFLLYRKELSDPAVTWPSWIVSQGYTSCESHFTVCNHSACA